MNDDPVMDEWLAKSTQASGVPVSIEDQAVIAQVAQLIQSQQIDG
ncbi:hypothetical protein [Streptomyces sp. DvalAA-19]|nr:hypothetical protein [Streptomyces sp. DvalAA-19]